MDYKFDWIDKMYIRFFQAIICLTIIGGTSFTIFMIFRIIRYIFKEPV